MRATLLITDISTFFSLFSIQRSETTVKSSEVLKTVLYCQDGEATETIINVSWQKTVTTNTIYATRK